MKNNNRDNLILTMVILIAFAFILYKIYSPVVPTPTKDNVVIVERRGWGGGWGL